MLNPISRKSARATFWLAAAAILFAALSPLANAWQLKAQPQLIAEICTTVGFVKIAADGTKVPATPTKHAAPCAWCVSPSAWLALTGSAQLNVPAIAGRHAAPAYTPQFVSLPPAHTLAWAHAPPAFS